MQFSPVRNVIENKSLIVIEDVTLPKYKAWHRYLTKLVDYRSCVGIPIQSKDITYAIFVFSCYPNKFKKEGIEKLQWTSVLIGSAIEMAKMEKHLRTLQKQAIIGQMTSGLTHEIRNRITAIKNFSESLFIDLDVAKNNRDAFLNDDFYNCMVESTTGIITANKIMSDVVELFREITKKDETELMEIKYVIETTIKRIQYTARTFGIRVVSKLDSSVEGIKCIGLRLAPVIENLVLNSIQQISINKIRNGWVRIEAQYFKAVLIN